ncbi:MAG: hypothetical protein KAY24_06865 [Candidatus Eisenbacteria sp.]|nr:hypothetical protein [Candidatus Eisenbacteria bacterium]
MEERIRDIETILREIFTRDGRFIPAPARLSEEACAAIGRLFPEEDTS